MRFNTNALARGSKNVRSGEDVITHTTAQQRLTALATREIEGRKINQLHSMEPSKGYSQWQGNNIRLAPPKLEMEQYWKSMEASPI